MAGSQAYNLKYGQQVEVKLCRKTKLEYGLRHFFIFCFVLTFINSCKMEHWTEQWTECLMEQGSKYKPFETSYF